MKALFIKLSAFFFLTAIFNSNNLNAQDSTKNKKPSKEVQVKKMVDSMDFIFVPRYVTPLRGTRRYLNTGYYFLDLNKDTLNSYLPYFGRSYVAPLSSTDIMFDFVSTNFQTSVTQKKKDRWEILIKLKDQVDVQQLYLTIFNDGTAWLSINTINREPISFEGFIKKPLPKKTKS